MIIIKTIILLVMFSIKIKINKKHQMEKIFNDVCVLVSCVFITLLLLLLCQLCRIYVFVVFPHSVQLRRLWGLYWPLSHEVTENLGLYRMIITLGSGLFLEIWMKKKKKKYRVTFFFNTENWTKWSSLDFWKWREASF